MIEAFIRKHPAATNPWGQGAIGLEWQLPARLPKQTIIIPVRVRR